MKVKINELTQLDIDILFALIDHFKYSVKDIDSYSELTDEEKDIISEDTWNKNCLKIILMEVKIKKLCETAVIPSYAKPGDAGMDLVATSRIFDKYGNVEYGTGLAMEIPEGYVGLIFARSSIFKQDLSLSNAVGVIDSKI